MSKSRSTSPLARSNRSDGERTRRDLLDAAGRVFANRGYSDATSKEICELAGTNTAAVNYYFGGRERLYHAVLIEAHKQLVALEDMQRIAAMNGAPEARLEALFGRFVRAYTDSSDHWGVRVWLREMLNPSSVAPEIIKEAVLPKALIGRHIVAEIIGYPEDSDEVQRALALTVLPWLSLVLVPESLRLQILPSTSKSEKAMQQEMIRYTLAGLQALKKR